MTFFKSGIYAFYFKQTYSQDKQLDKQDVTLGFYSL